MKTLRLKLTHELARVPSKASIGSGGLDLYATENVTIPAAKCLTTGGIDVGRALIPIGIEIELPKGTIGRIGSRSGLSVKSNVEVGAGWIDSDYRGQLFVELKNLSSKPVYIKIHDKVAQLFVLPIVEVEIIQTSNLSNSSRGKSGFGSSD